MLQLIGKFVKFQKLLFDVCRIYTGNNGSNTKIPDIKVDLVIPNGTSNGIKNKISNDKIDLLNKSKIDNKPKGSIFRRSQSCMVQDSPPSKRMNDVRQLSQISMQTKNLVPLTTSCSTLVQRTISNASLNDSSLQRQNFLELMADPNYYHTVHGGRKRHVTASRSTEPLSPITRISIGDQNFLQTYEEKVERAYSAAPSPSKGIGVKRTLFMKLVRPIHWWPSFMLIGILKIDTCTMSYVANTEATYNLAQTCYCRYPVVLHPTIFISKKCSVLHI